MNQAQQIETEEERLARAALAISYALTFSVPLAINNHLGLACAGTGTLFQLIDRYFIITAAHVCKGDLNKLFIPAHGDLEDPVGINIIKSCFTGNQHKVDVGFIEISQETYIHLKTKNYNFAHLGMIDLRGPADPALIVGYPETNYPINGKGVIRSLSISSKKIDAPQDVDPPSISGLDVFYHFSRSAFRLEGSRWVQASSPELHGVSGASVWCLLRPLGHWDPKRDLAITGIEIAYKHSEYARTQSWGALIKLFGKCYIDMAEVLASKVGVNLDEFKKAISR